MSRVMVLLSPPFGRTPQGVRGLKFDVSAHLGAHAGRTPQGVRGLKYNNNIHSTAETHVAPRKG